MHFPTQLLLTTLSTLSLSLSHTLSPSVKVTGACTGAGGAPGVCIATAKCTSAGGSFISNACPGTPAHIKCCTKTSCGSGGNCRFTSSCSTFSISGLCPGPADFKCCVPKSGGGEGQSFPAPTIPKFGACKSAAVNGVNKMVAALPGTVMEIGCTRDCTCGCSGCSVHCCGMATDLMCSSAGGVSTESGKEIAEWIMNHADELNLSYVMWGQKIWSTARDKVIPWSEWTDQSPKGRGSITQNHC